MENNKKKKYYQYSNNKNHYSYNNHKNHNKKKKKEVYVNEKLQYNEYEGLCKKSDNNYILDDDNILVKKNNNNSQDLNKILIRKDDTKKINEDLIIEENEEKKSKKSFVIRTRLGYLLGILILVFALFGSTYAFFNYYKEDTRQADITSGEVYLRVVENNLSLSLSNQYPRTIAEARARNDNYIDFTLVGKNTSLTKVLNYKFTLSNGADVSGKTRINNDYVLFDLAELDSNNEETLLLSGVSFANFNSANIGSFYIPTNQTTELQRRYRIRAWISEDVTISDDPEENATYTQAQFANLFGNFTFNVNSQDRTLNLGSKAVMKAIDAKINAQTNACNPIWIDDMGTTEDTTDDITYFSGTNDCVDMNYVWYSGKLWRITAIYPDGSMKMITEDALTAINWGSTVEYDGSWIYQWLNEDFYDTLVNSSGILISNATWNYSTDGNDTPVRPESIATQKTKEAPIGLLNAYEYYNAYRNASTSTNYLNVGYYWWLLTPYSTSNVLRVRENGRFEGILPAGDSSSGTDISLAFYSASVRPAVNLKSGIEFSGSGTKDNPYKIVGDKENPASGVLISSRSSGEYVKFDNDIYRIVSIDTDDENGTITKLTKVDYLRDNETVITKNFASTEYFGKSTNTKTDTFWDYYLNNTWYDGISSTYKDMLVDGTYYLGLYPDNINYKATICKDSASILDSTPIKNCTKYTSSDANKIFRGKVGLPRIGEMFSGRLGSVDDIWTITPHSTSIMRYNVKGALQKYSPAGLTLGVRLSINLKSTVKITSGTGYSNSPFEISE